MIAPEARLFDGRTVVVTGAAHGIGRGIAELFLSHGANVVGGDELAIGRDDTLNSAGERFASVVCDASDDEAMRGLVATARARFGRIDCLVNNAASSGSMDGIAEMTPEAFDRTVAVVLRSTFLGMHHAVPVMRAQGGGGAIINIGSTSALRAAAVLQPYGAAKAGVAMLTQNAAVELGPEGIRVNCVCPGGIATAMYGLAAGLDRAEAEARRATIAANLAPLQLLGRAGTPRDVANAVLWLASDLAAYVTGQVIAVDGGMSVGRPMTPGVTAQQFFRRIAGVTQEGTSA